MKKRRLVVFLCLFLALAGLVAAQPAPPAKPSPTDKCPVCGMFVAKYPDFVARIVFQDGSYAFFDGVKDMLKFYFALDRYRPGKKIADIVDLAVTDYYSLTLIDAKKAYYVIGSNVYGPMGRELIPCRSEAEAKEFRQDHGGQAILTFEELRPETLRGLD